MAFTGPGGGAGGSAWSSGSTLSSSYGSSPALPVGSTTQNTGNWSYPVGQPTPTSSGKGSNWWGSLTDPLGFVSATEQLAGGLGAGVGKIIWRAGQTVGDTLYNAGQDVSGHADRANWGYALHDLEKTGQGVGSFAVGLPLAAESLAKTAAHVVGGADLANLATRDVFQPFNRFLSNGIGTDQFGVQHFNQGMDPQTAQALRGENGKGMVPVDAIQEAKQGGLGAAAMYTGAQAAMIFGPAAGVADGMAGSAGDAATAATEAGDEVAAAKYAARQAKLQTFAETMHALARPFHSAYEGAADFFGAQRTAAFPPITTVTEETPMEPVPPETAAHRDLMSADAAAADAMHEMTTQPEPTVSNTGYPIGGDLAAALDTANNSYETVPYEEPKVPRGMTRLYSSSDDPSLWTSDKGRAENPPGSHVGGVNVRHIDVPREEAAAMQTAAGSPADTAARASGHQTNTATDYYLNAGDLEKYTPEEHVPSMRRQVQVEATPAEAPTEPGRYKVDRNQPLTPEEKIARDEALRSDTADARDTMKPDLFVMDELGKRLSMPTPQWATWLADTMPTSWNRALSKMGAGFFDKVRLRAVLRNAEQAMQTAQQAARTSDAYTAGQEAATTLLSRTVGRATAAARVGEEINARLTTEALRDMWRSQHNGFTPSDAQKTVLDTAAKRGYIGITDEMMQALPVEDRAKLVESLNAAVDAYKVQAQQTFQTLLSTRYGAQGLESAILDPDGAQWTPEQKRLFNRVLRDERLAAKARERIPNEIAKAAADSAKADALGVRAWGFVDQLRARLGLTLQTVDELWRGIPKGLANDGEQTTALTMQTVAQEGGAYMDIGTGLADHPTGGIYVPIQQQFDMPIADWVQHGPQALHDAMFSPTAFDGQTYRDPAALWGGPDARLSVNIVNGLDGGQRVVGTLAMHTIAGEAIKPWQAFLLGSAHEQVGGYNFATGDTVPFAADAMEQTLAKHYVSDVLNPGSELTRWGNQRAELLSKNPDINISVGELNNEMLFNLWTDKVMQGRNARWAQGDIFKTDTVFAKGQPNLAYLAQTIMPELGVGEHLDRAMSMFNAEDVNRALAWYYKSHDFVESLYRGKTIPLTGRDAAETMYDLIALTSVMASPTQNLGRALMGMANLDEFLKARQASLDSARGTVDELLNQASKDPAERAYVQNLNQPGEREVDASRAQERGVTAVSRRWLQTPELRELSKGTSMVTSPKYRIIDAILGNLNLATATNEDISGQPEWWLGDKVLLSDNNLSPEAVMHHAQLLGADQTPTYARYADWAQQHAQLVQAKEEDTNSVTNAQLTKSEVAGRALAKSPDLSRAYENALMEVHGSSALAKLRSFRENLAMPHSSLAVTLDSIMAQLFGFEKTHWNMSGEYAKYADHIRQSASEWSDIAGRQVMPHEVQALLWVYAKRFIGERDWGRLLAHTQNLHDQIDAMSEHAAQGPIDVRNFHPYGDWWDQETQFSKDMLAVRGERKTLRLAEKAGTITSEEARQRLDYLNALPERRASEAQFMTPGGTIETGIRDETYYDKKVLSGKEAQRAKFEEQYSQPIRDAVAAGDWARAHELADKAAITRKASILGEAPGTEFNVGMLKKGSKGLEAIQRLREATYAPSPNEEALSTSELYDAFHDRVRGATIVNDNRLSRIMMKMYATADVSTLLHEDLHAFRLMAPGNDVVDFERAYPGIQDPLNKQGFMTAARIGAEEKFVGDFMNYLRLRRLEQPYGGPMGRLFNMVADAMDAQFQPALSTVQGGTIPNEIVGYWDSIFNHDIQSPTAMEDPLRAEYQGRNLRPVPLAGETDSAFVQRVRQYGEARGQAQVLQERIRDAEQRAVKADNFARKMQGLMLEPTKSEVRASYLEARASGGLNKIEQGLSNAPIEKWPVQWRPFGQAIQAITEEIKKDPTLAPLMDEISANFEKALQFAAERGFDPVYLPTMTWDMAQKYMWGHLRIDGTAEEASMRFENRGAMDKQQIGDHTLNALGAGSVMAMKESIQSALAGHIEDSYGYKLPAGAPLPEGWRFWSATRDAILTGRKLDGTEGRVAIGGEQTIIPEQVFRVLRDYQKDPVDLPFRTLWKGAPNAVWKALILTYSTTWYIKHFIGAVSLATLEGARWADWQKAWDQWKTNTLPDTVRGREFMPTYDEEQGAVNSGIKSRLFSHPVQAIGGELSQMPDSAGAIAKTAEGAKFVVGEINRSLRNVVKTVDGLSRAAVYARAIADTGDPSFAAWRSYEAIGDFGRLNPIERSLVTQIMPFYAFQKAMYRLLLRLPIDHPVAAAMAMQVGMMNQAYVKDKLGGILPTNYLGSAFMGGTLDNPTQLVQLDKLNPLTDSYKIMTPEGLASSVNPFLQLFGQYAMHTPAFNSVPGISGSGQLVQQPDLLKGIESVYTGAVPSVGNGMVIPTNTLSTKQLASLTKRIQTDLKAMQSVKSGGYLTTDAVAPKQATSGGSGGSAFGGGSTKSAGTWGSTKRSSRVRSTFRIRKPRAAKIGKVRAFHVPKVHTSHISAPHVRLTSSFTPTRTHHRTGF